MLHTLQNDVLKITVDDHGAELKSITGVSDGTNVQILSGLQQGQVVYYRYADSIEYSFVRLK